LPFANRLAPPRVATASPYLPSFNDVGDYLDTHRLESELSDAVALCVEDETPQPYPAIADRLLYRGAEMAVAWDYGALCADLRALIKERRCGPLLIRLSFQDACAFSAALHPNGAPNAALRFTDGGEGCFAANAGLATEVVPLLEPLKTKYPLISRADLWALAANVALESMVRAWPRPSELARARTTHTRPHETPDAAHARCARVCFQGGPKVFTRFGRRDAVSFADGAASPDGRLPDETGLGLYDHASYLRRGKRRGALDGAAPRAACRRPAPHAASPATEPCDATLRSPHSVSGSLFGQGAERSRARGAPRAALRGRVRARTRCAHGGRVDGRPVHVRQHLLHCASSRRLRAARIRLRPFHSSRPRVWHHHAGAHDHAR
jgi:hypothetical protein